MYVPVSAYTAQDEVHDVLMILLILLLLAFVAPAVARRGPRAAASLALAPAAVTVYFVLRLPELTAGSEVVEAWPWMSALGLEMRLRIDGLSALFGLMVAGVGTLVVVYAAGYFGDPARRGRFLAFLLAFAVSMLGLVLADDLILLFLFWEATTVTSFLLIGFDHQKEAARKAALQSLLVTGLGGLALLAAFLLLGEIAGTYALSEIVSRGSDLAGHPLMPVVFGLLVLGAFTKSAQFPFHFWLPNAMAAPTPASAYLHSSTMVKAGVYLLARLHPALGEFPAWTPVLLAAGGTTMLLASVLALRQTDLKRMAAFSTLTILGTLVALLGLGTPLAIWGAIVLLATHTLYKGALFLLIGVLDQATGSRDLRRLGGLRRTMPLLAFIGALAGLSMAGVPPFFGFIGKEAVLEAAWRAPSVDVLLAAGVLVTGMLTAAAGFLIGLRPFFGGELPTVGEERLLRPGAFLLAGPVVLAVSGVVFGLWPGFLGEVLLAPAASAVLGTVVEKKLAVWHGFGAVLFLGLGKVLGGVMIYLAWDRLRDAGRRGLEALEHGPSRLYDGAVRTLLAVARWQTDALQSATLARHLRIILAVILALVGFTLTTRLGWPEMRLGDVGLWELALAAMILAGAGLALTAHSRLSAVVALGVVGYGLSLVFLYFGAPDLAMTQLVVETLTVVLAVFAFRHLPAYRPWSPKGTRRGDLALAIAIGVLMGGLTLAAVDVDLAAGISNWFAAESVPGGKGRNVVNVILVDFRALDTLGEITVLAVAGLGAVALLRSRRRVVKGGAA